MSTAPDIVVKTPGEIVHKTKADAARIAAKSDTGLPPN